MSNDFLPMMPWMTPYRSTRYSILPRLMSSTALPTFGVTVPLFGFGMRPRGPRIWPSLPTMLIWSGVATATSNSVKFSSRMRAARSSDPTMSAPASSASRAFSPTAKTATRCVLPVPFGSMSVPRTIWSALRGSTLSLTWTSTLSSKFAPSRLFSNSSASRGVYSRSRSTLAFCSKSFLPIDRYPHAPRRSLDDLRRPFDVDGVQVRHLRACYLLDLRPANRADLLAVRFAATLLEARGLLEQERRGGRLGDKGERAVLVDRDLHGDHLAHLVAGRVVELPHELPDVHLRLAQGRSYRRRRVGLTARDLQLQFACDTFAASSAHNNSFLTILELSDLAEGELDRRLPPEDRDQDLQPRLVHVYLGDHARKVRQGAGDDLHRLPDRVINRGPDLLAGLDL